MLHHVQQEEPLALKWPALLCLLQNCIPGMIWLCQTCLCTSRALVKQVTRQSRCVQMLIGRSLVGTYDTAGRDSWIRLAKPRQIRECNRADAPHHPP